MRACEERREAATRCDWALNVERERAKGRVSVPQRSHIVLYRGRGLSVCARSVCARVCTRVCGQRRCNRRQQDERQAAAAVAVSAAASTVEPPLPPPCGYRRSRSRVRTQRRRLQRRQRRRATALAAAAVAAAAAAAVATAAAACARASRGSARARARKHCAVLAGERSTAECGRNVSRVCVGVRAARSLTSARTYARARACTARPAAERARVNKFASGSPTQTRKRLPPPRRSPASLLCAVSASVTPCRRA